MDEQIKRDLLIKDILALSNRAYVQSGEIPVSLSDENLSKMTAHDLMAVKRDLRDLVRSLGGARE